MGIEVTIDMENPNALCTVGMLSALLENGSKDYTDLISPFILASLPDVAGEEIDIIEVQKKVKDYGFEDMPLDFIRGVLQRHTNKQPSYVKRENRKYYVDTPFDKRKMIDNQREIRKEIEYVLEKIQEYLQENFAHKKLPIRDIESMLVNFFKSCGFEMARNINNLTTITTKQTKEVFWIARYVLSTVESNSIEKDYLVEIVKGFLIYNALYFFENKNKVDFYSKLRNVTFYLDCSLVINCLGYDSNEDEQEILELIHLIRKSGGKVCVFKHTVDEAESLLHAFARMQKSRNSFHLFNLTEKAYPPEILALLASSVEDTLKDKENIETLLAPNYTRSENYAGVQAEKEIADWLETNRKYIHRKYSIKERTRYDVKSLSAIGMIRKSSHPEKIEHAKAILVTQDYLLSRCMKTLYPDEFPPEIDFVMTDVDLASLLWLSNYNKTSSLPTKMLIANAMSLNLATPEIMEKAFDLTDKLVERKELSPDAALIIRSQPAIRQILSDITQNDVDVLTNDGIQQVIKNYVDSESEVRIERINSEWKNRVSEKDSEIKRLRAEMAEERNKTIRKHTNRAEKNAKMFARIFECISIAFFTIILVGTFAIWAFKLFDDYQLLHGLTGKCVFSVLDFLSALQIYDYFKNPNGPIKRISSIIHDSVFSYLYSYYIKKWEDE